MNLPEFFIWIFISGCIGAVAPEIVRLYKARNNPKFNMSCFYLIISFLFILLGGFVAWILPATSLWGAFYVGVSLPIIISSIGRSKKLLEPEKLSKQEQVLNSYEKYIQELTSRNKFIIKEINDLRHTLNEIKPFLPLEKRKSLEPKIEVAKLGPIPSKMQFFIPKEKFINRLRNYLGILYQ